MDTRSTLAGAYALFAIPVLFLLYSLLGNERATIDVSERELAGNAYLGVAAQAQQALYEFAGRAAATPSEIELWRADLLRTANELAAAETDFGSQMALASLSRKAIERLRDLSEVSAGANRNPAAAALRGLIGGIGDQSGLILDTEIDSFYTIDMLVVELPELADRVVGTVDPVGPIDAAAGASREGTIDSLYAIGRLVELCDRLQADVNAVGRGGADQGLRADLSGDVHALKASLDALAVDNSRKIVDGHGSEIDPGIVRRSGRLALEGIWRIQNTAHTMLDELLQRRIDRLTSGRRRILTISVGLFAIAIICNVILIRCGVLGPIRNLMAKQVASEAAARASQESLRAIMDHIVDGLLTFDQGWTILSFSKPAERIFGYRAEDIIGHNVGQLIRPCLEREGPQASFIGGDPTAIVGACREVQGRRKDGSLFPADFEVAGIPVINGGHRFVGTVRDITGRKLTEAQLRQAQKMQAIGNLAAGIAHNFNNLLGTILGFGEFLCQDLIPGTDQHQFAQRIVKATHHGRTLVNQFTAFSRPSAIEPVALRLADALAEAGDLLRATLPATTQVAIVNHGGDAVILGDRDQIVQMLVGLCVNASDALEGVPGIVSIEAKRPDHQSNDPMPPGFPDGSPFAPWDGISQGEAEEGQFLAGNLPDRSCALLTITDTGAGIPTSSLSQIFDPFFTTKFTGQGTGLGLSIVHRIVIEHGGAILVKTRRGEGTSFTVMLPLKDN